MDGSIGVEAADGVAILTLDRPAKRNALTRAMYAALAEALAAAEADPAVRVVLLTGAGEAFTAGNDLDDFLRHPPGDPASSPVFRVLQGAAAAEKPLVAAVRGAAVGIGTTLLLHCDLVYAAEDARFRLPFVDLGLVPEGGSSLLLPALVGQARAAELLLLGEPFDAAAAHAMGLVTAVVPAAALTARALERARTLADKPAESVRLTKRLLRRGRTKDVSGRIAEEGGYFAARLASPEFRAAIAAFHARKRA